MVHTSALGRLAIVSVTITNAVAVKTDRFFSDPMKQVDSTMVEIQCQCGQTTVKRYTGRYCGPHRRPCTRKEKGVNDSISTLENVWVDGNNTYHHKKSDIRSFPLFPTWP